MHRKMRALRAGVSYINQCVTRKLSLNIQIPLLHVRWRIVDERRAQARSLDVDELLVAPHWLNNPTGKRIAQRILRENALRALGCNPRLREGVYEEIVRSIVPADIDRQVKHSVATPNDCVGIELVRQTDAGTDVFPCTKGSATRQQRRMHQRELALQVRHADCTCNGAGRVWQEGDLAIKSFRPISL